MPAKKPSKRDVNALLSELTLPVPSAGRVLGLSRNKAYDAAKSGEIPTLKFGRRLVVPTAALRSMLGLPPLTTQVEEVDDATA